MLKSSCKSANTVKPTLMISPEVKAWMSNFTPCYVAQITCRCLTHSFLNSVCSQLIKHAFRNDETNALSLVTHDVLSLFMEFSKYVALSLALKT